MTTRTSILLHFDADDISHRCVAPSADGPGYASLDIGAGDPRSSVTLFFDDTAAVDAAIRQLAALKTEMLGTIAGDFGPETVDGGAK